jgi:hypothetical protein
MFEAFKKLFSKRANPPAAVAPMTEEQAPAPAPVPRMSPPVPRATAPAPGPIPKQASDMIVLPLNEVLSRLPSTLARLVLSRPKGTFSFPASVALEQLRTGAVRISFSQLRQSAPPGTFADNTTHDDSLIDLPLSVVLAAIGPGGQARQSQSCRGGGFRACGVAKRAQAGDSRARCFAANRSQASDRRARRFTAKRTSTGCTGSRADSSGRGCKTRRTDSSARSSKTRRAGCAACNRAQNDDFHCIEPFYDKAGVPSAFRHRAPLAAAARRRARSDRHHGGDDNRGGFRSVARSDSA